MNQYPRYIYRILSSRWFFIGIVVFFAFESIWIAFSAKYPQAFDENFHYGLIQVYSHYWFPFLSRQPPNANAYGAVARDPSYLYHYVLSFPYRLIAQIFHSLYERVISLRLINIILFGFGIIASRRLLVRVGISKALASLVILCFTLIPIVPQLAAQINYDNLLIPLVVCSLLLTIRLTDELRAHKPTVKSLIELLILCLLTTLVKYAFLPIFMGIVLWLIYLHVQFLRRDRSAVKIAYSQSFHSLSKITKAALLIGLVVASGMVIQRDGINLIRYHQIEPDCAKVLSVQDCTSYSAWYYTYETHRTIQASVMNGTLHFTNPIPYVGQWAYWMWYRLFFAVNGPASSFTNYPPLPIPAATALVIGFCGLLATLRYARVLFRRDNYFALLALCGICYVLVLIAQGYVTYRYTDVLENMNGRYLLPVIILFAPILAKAFSLTLRDSQTRRAILAMVVVIALFQGGGFLTFISRGDDSWEVSNKTVQQVNNAARKVTSKVILKGSKQYKTSIWFFN